MADLIIPEGVPEIVNLQESKCCCFCGSRIHKRKQMWRYSDDRYVCIFCKTRFSRSAAEQSKGDS